MVLCVDSSQDPYVVYRIRIGVCWETDCQFSLEWAFTLVRQSSPRQWEESLPFTNVWWGCLFSGCLGDTQFSFRMRQCGGQKSLWHGDDRPYNSKAPLALQVSNGMSHLSSFLLLGAPGSWL